MDKAAIYCRLSKEDYDKINEGDESESITNQKMLLTEYAIGNDYLIYDYYIDEDYSGLYHDRPAFDRLIKDAQSHKFNLILAKTQSRFTRNMEHAEKYLHNIFPLLGIRFIGVVDGVDSSMKSNKKARQINGLINEWYSEDLSDNIRAVFREKMRKGQFIGSFVCYGYKKDPKDHHKIVIDEEAAQVVKRIFHYCFDGYGVSYIARKLTQEGIPTPTNYKQQKGLRFYNPNSGLTKKENTWSVTTIKRILNNEVYTGTLIQGREKKLSYKSKKVILTPKTDWIYVPNNHEAIVSKELYDRTQDALKSRRKSCNQTSEPHLLAGKVKCADCHNLMVKTSGKSPGAYHYLICQQSRNSSSKRCSRHSIRFDTLKQIIEDRLSNLLQRYIKENKELLQQHLPLMKPTRLIQKLEQELSTTEIERADYEQSIACLYIDKTKGVLSEAEFMQIKSTINQRLDEMLLKSEQLKKELLRLSSYETNQLKLFEMLLRQIQQNELTYDMIQLFIDVIYVSEKQEGQQSIEIHWVF